MKEDKIALGLAVSALSLREGETRSCEQLAAYCDVSKRAIQKIEATALRKMRQKLWHVAQEEGIGIRRDTGSPLL